MTGERPHRICALVRLRPDSDAAIRARVREALLGANKTFEGVHSSHAEFDLPGSVGGGDLTWDFAVCDQKAREALEKRFPPDSSQLLVSAIAAGDAEIARAIERIDAAVLETILCETEWNDFGAHPESIKRTNFVRVLESAPPAQFMRWLRDVPRLADHVPAIKNWSLSRVRAFLGAPPPIVWTHCWEQEFARESDLHADYMMSPYHWGFLDGYYDLEDPRCIMDPQLAHLFCRTRGGVLRGEAAGQSSIQRMD